MSDRDKIMAMIALLDSEDASAKTQAQEEIRAMGEDAIPYLNRARGQPKRWSYVAVFEMLAMIGDDLFVAGGSSAVNKSIVDSMEFGAKSVMKSTPPEIKPLATEALTRWGMDVPVPKPPKVFNCHVCNASSTDERVVRCFLQTCENAICREHAHIIETRFGKMTGTGGAWFCTAEHKEYANTHPEVMQ